MACLFSELRCKEVIDLHSGQRLGYVCDAEYEPCDGKILAIIVPGQGRAGGLLGREDDYVIPWSSISRLGSDIILVDLQQSPSRRRGEKRAVLYWYRAAKRARGRGGRGARRFFGDTKKARRQASLVSGVFTALRRRGSPFRCGGSGCRRRRAWGFRLLWP